MSLLPTDCKHDRSCRVPSTLPQYSCVGLWKRKVRSLVGGLWGFARPASRAKRRFEIQSPRSGFDPRFFSLWTRPLNALLEISLCILVDWIVDALNPTGQPWNRPSRLQPLIHPRSNHPPQANLVITQQVFCAKSSPSAARCISSSMDSSSLITFPIKLWNSKISAILTGNWQIFKDFFDFQREHRKGKCLALMKKERLDFVAGQRTGEGMVDRLHDRACLRTHSLQWPGCCGFPSGSGYNGSRFI